MTLQADVVLVHDIQRAQVGLGARVVRIHLGQLPTEELRRQVGTEVGQICNRQRIVDDLLLEQRGQDDGGRTGLGELEQRVDVAGERRRRRDDRVGELETQVVGTEINGHSSTSAYTALR